MKKQKQKQRLELELEPMNCRHHDEDNPCPVCAGLDEYAPVMYTPEGHIGDCSGSEMQKKLCLDGYGCFCEVISPEFVDEVDLSFNDLLEMGATHIEDLKTENRRMLTAFEAISKIACDMLDPVKRAGPGG